MNIIQRYDTMNDFSSIDELMELVERKTELFMKAHLGYGRVEYVNRGRCGNPLTPAMREEMRSRVQHEVLACTRPGTLERKRLLERIAREFGVHYQTVIKHTADLRGVLERK